MFSDSEYSLSWGMFYVSLRRVYILMSKEVFYKCQLDTYRHL